MADINQNKAEQYRKERKARLAKAAKKNAKNIEKKTAVRSAVKKTVAIVLAAVIGLACLGGILSYVGVLQSMASIGYVKDEHISFAEYKYYYITAYNNFYQTEYQNQSYAQYYGTSGSTTGYDISLSPENQTTTTTDEDGNEITWVEYFHNQALSTAQMYLAYYQEAVKENLTLDEAELKEIDESIEELRETANKQGTSDSDDENIKGYSLNAYLRLYYGNGITSSFLKKQMKKEALARKYYQSQTEILEKGYSEEEVKAEFDKDPDSYLYTDIRCYQFTIETATAEEDEDEDAVAKKQEKASKEAKDNANKLYDSVKDEKSFKEAATKLNSDNEEYDVDAETLLKAYKKSDTSTSNLSSVNSDLADWAFSDDRKANDKKLITIKGDDDSATGYIVALMINPKYDAKTVAVRHILFKTVDDSNNSLSDEEINKAKANADKTLAEWKAGGATEESFADYAIELSEDTGSQADGGLYENIAPNQMVTEFNDWIFDESRKEGDCEIVETTYGYHIIYFKGVDGTSMDNTIRANLASEDLAEKSESLLASDDYKVCIGPRRTSYIEKDLLKKIAKQVSNYNTQSSSY